MTVSIDLTVLSNVQLARVGLVAGLLKRREGANLSGRIAAAMRRAVEAEEVRRISRAAGRLQVVPIDTDADAAPDVADAELQRAIGLLCTIRDSAGTDDPARDVWNELLVALAELRDQRAVERHQVVDLMYPSRSVPDNAA
jgi:hypothetical protein